MPSLWSGLKFIRKMSNYNIENEDDDGQFDEDSRMDRWSRNSTGTKEEFLGPRKISKSIHSGRATSTASQHSHHSLLGGSQEKKKDDKMLMIVFILMVFVGLGNKVFNKLMTIPMHNYPNFLNLLTTFVYVPVCFAYIIPMARAGHIPKEQIDMPKKPFAIMGSLDALAGIMQIFSATYLPGPLVILLVQSAVPVSMIISKYLLKAEYNKYQYIGAFIVAAGIVVVLLPQMTGGGSPLWAIMMILSTIPMTLSSVYKEIALGETELDAVYLNGWVAVFQLAFSIVLCVPLSLASDPPVPIPELPKNLYDGLLCYFGISSITCTDDSNCTADQCYMQGPLFVNVYLFFNQLYNLLIILILKYGSSNILYMALTLMVPLGNVAFTLDFVPEHSALRVTDIIGLIVICMGLGCYRFMAGLVERYFGPERKPSLVYKDEEKVVHFSEHESLVADLMAYSEDTKL